MDNRVKTARGIDYSKVVAFEKFKYNDPKAINEPNPVVWIYRLHFSVGSPYIELRVISKYDEQKIDEALEHCHLLESDTEMMII